MIDQKESVDWAIYAQSYDLLLSYNPFYQALQQDILDHIMEWDIQAGDLLIDLGAGTGNYSVPMARLFPQAEVLHIEPNPGMNEQCREKVSKSHIENLKILSMDAEKVSFEPQSIKAAICIHALYTFSAPQQSLQDLYDWLIPGGTAILVNAGRIVKILDWQLAIGWHLIKTYGIRKTLEIMKSGKEVSRQNAYIRKKQLKGEYWLHSHEEFLEAVKVAGFNILSSKKAFRGISDFVVAQKDT